jgi:hypothetical protein
MGLRIQRRIRLLPGIHLNLSARGVGVSVGSRGAHIGIDARGRRYTSLGVPGTGISWREYQRTPAPGQCDLCAPGHAHVPAWLAALLFILAIIAVLLLAAR